MNPSAFHKPSVHGGTSATTYNRIVSQPELNVTLVEPVLIETIQPLSFGEPNEFGTRWAELTHSQTRALAIHLRKVLEIDTPLPNVQLTLESTGQRRIAFTVDPRVLHSQVIIPCRFDGLSIVFVSGSRLGFDWIMLRGSSWPIWLTL